MGKTISREKAAKRLEAIVGLAQRNHPDDSRLKSLLDYHLKTEIFRTFLLDIYRSFLAQLKRRDKLELKISLDDSEKYKQLGFCFDFVLINKEGRSKSFCRRFAVFSEGNHYVLYD